MQSGSDGVLKRMNRHYTSREFLDKVALIRKHFPHAGITTDVIVAFPGETDDEFSESMKTVEQACFLDMHVFPYSIRPGTKAANMQQRRVNAQLYQGVYNCACRNIFQTQTCKIL